MANSSAYLSLFSLVLVAISSCNEVFRVPNFPLDPNYYVKLSKTHEGTHVVRFTAELGTTLAHSDVPKVKVRFVSSDNLPEPHVKDVTLNYPKVDFEVDYNSSAVIEHRPSMNVQVYMGKDLIAMENVEFDLP